jgi:chromosome segregation ATPase
MLKLACEACEKRLHDIEMLRLELDAERKARKESDKLKSEANYRLSENAEALKARAEKAENALAIRNSEYDTLAEKWAEARKWLNEADDKNEKAEKKNAELKAEVAGWQRGEAKVKEAMDKVYDERDNWKRNYEALKARAEKAEAKLAAVPNDCREVCEDHKALKAKLRRAEAQLAAIEKDLRELEGFRLAKVLLGKHFNDKKAQDGSPSRSLAPDSPPITAANGSNKKEVLP